MRQGICRVCGSRFIEDTSDLVGCRLTWHVFEQHRDIWKTIFKDDHHPLDPDPRTKRGRQRILSGNYAASEDQI